MHSRPHFKEYILARLVTMAVGILLLIALFLFSLLDDIYVVYMVLLLIAMAFSMFIFAIYRGAKRMEKELTTINTYLKNLTKIDKVEYKAHFFTHEFEEINLNLIKVLRKSKKREEVKQRYNAKLKLKNRQRADMISAIAHEFRNPIASIMGYAQTLEEDKHIPPALQEKFLGKIYNNGNKIESLLSRLVLWNKFESGEANVHPTKFDVMSLLEEVKLSLFEKYSTREIQIIGNRYEVDADRTLIEIVVKNLIENALKYSKDEVIVSVKEGIISVHDKGDGVLAKDISKLTKKFYRSDTQNWDNSMGLGLSIVKSILTLHHSELEIESELNIGSTFSFKI
ncbi:MAG: Sensor histidine kinase [uncultured Sulfurovum sp.]|uniref:histidine kinase n=1 Tax=uncultured Sulfurovum sp. TaxID=269237 RepID=A0A6S6SBE2_9BACT|nr:MAG: Sensor histidine kinase [uncultured Sulfurovum sp.]